jgi:[NiFe] hydrogenase diaphorase moiety small subunit
MSERITFTIDGVAVEGLPGQSIIDVADDAGIYIPRLCHQPDLVPHGSCRVCTVMVNGRPAAACTQPINAGMVVENETETIREYRKVLIEMLFVEGNHYCMFCEKSGNCELQGLAYRFGITAPRFPYLFPKREVDASHPDALFDENRCILCARCVRASREKDGKEAFGFVGRGPHKRLAFNSETDLAGTDLHVDDQALDACPVGALLRKRVGYRIPVGQRLYDKAPIGSDIEARKAASIEEQSHVKA